MEVDFKELNIDSRDELEPYLNLREIENCEYNFNTLYMWHNYYKTYYHIEDNFVVFSERLNDHPYTVMPLCREEHFSDAFNMIYSYFKEQEVPFEMYVVDKIFANFIKDNYNDRFKVFADRNSFDYIYCADELRSLKGKKFHKKRNHINSFYKEYEGRFKYRELNYSDKKIINEFLTSWKIGKEEKIEQLDEELIAINNIIDHLDKLDIKIGGVFIDEKLEAISIGSLINSGKEAVIHVEKANDNIRGLYPFINQQFLINEFPNVEIVNREEDMGIKGLRKAKKSYKPIKLLEKYTILDKVV